MTRLPTVGADADAWGDVLNAHLTSQRTLLATDYADVDPTGATLTKPAGLRQMLLDAAAAAATTGRRAQAVIPAGTYKCDWTGHAPLTADVTTSLTSFTVTVESSLSDLSGYSPAGGQFALVAAALDNSISFPATSTVTYTARSGGTFTGCTVTAGNQGRVYKASLSDAIMPTTAGSGANPDIWLDVEACHNVELVLASGCVLDVSRLVAYNQGSLGPGYGPKAISRQVATATLNTQYWITADVERGQQYVDVGSAAQPNTITSGQAIPSTASNAFKDGDWVLLGSRKMTGWDRASCRGEQLRVAAVSEFANYMSGNTDPSVVQIAASATASVGTPLTVTMPGVTRHRSMFDPGNFTAKLAVDLASGTGAGTVIELTSATGGSAIDALGVESCLVMLDDGTNVEFVKLDRGTRKTATPGASNDNYRLDVRALYGTTAHAFTAVATTVRLVGLVRIGSELMAYGDITAGGASLQIIRRALNGTSAVDHTGQDYIFPVPPPGVIYTFQQAQDWYAKKGLQASYQLAQTLPGSGSGGYLAYGGTAEAKELYGAEAFGVMEVVSTGERFSYQQRSDGKLVGIRRGVDGTTASVTDAAANSVIRQVGPHCALASAIGGSGSNITSVPVNGGNALRRPVDSFVQIDSEVIWVKTASPGNGTAVTTLSGTITDTATTLTPVTTAGFNTDGSGNLYFTIDDEVFSGTISGGNIINLERGYWGTFPEAHTAGVSIRQVKSWGVGTESAYRAQFGTTIAAHSTAATVRETDGATLEVVNQLVGFRITGKGQITGQTTDLPRITPTFALGVGAGGRQTAVFIERGWRCVVDGPTLFHTEREGVTWIHGIDCHVSNCYMEGINRSGFGDSTNWIGACQDCTVHDSTFFNVRHGGIASAAGGGQVGMQRRCRFHDNKVEWTVNAGFEAQAASEDIHTYNNEYVNCFSVGELFSNARFSSVGARVRGSGGQGIQAGNMVNAPLEGRIDDYVIEDCDEQGIYVHPDSGSVQSINNLAGGLLQGYLDIGDGEITRCKNGGILVFCGPSTQPVPGPTAAIPVVNWRWGGIRIGSPRIRACGNPYNSTDFPAISVQQAEDLQIGQANITDQPGNCTGILLTDCLRFSVQRPNVRFKTSGAKTAILVTTSANAPTGASDRGSIAPGHLVSPGATAATGVKFDSGVTNSTIKLPDSTLGLSTPTDKGAGAGNATETLGGSIGDASVGLRHLTRIARERFVPSGYLAQSMARNSRLIDLTGMLVSGRLHVVGGLSLAGGVSYTQIAFCSGTTAAGVPTNQWFCLVDPATLNVVAVTGDDTTTAWAADTVKALTIVGGGYTPTVDIEVLVGVMVAAATVPTLVGIDPTKLHPLTDAPVMTGTSTTTLTTPLTVGTTIATPGTGVLKAPWAGVK